MIFDYRSFYGLLEATLEARGEKLRPWLADHLQLSRYQVSRRLNGVSATTVDELITILIKAPSQALLSFELFDQLNLLIVEYSSFGEPEEFAVYFNRLEELFTAFSKLEGVCMHYAARDVPLFFFLADKLLLEFKYTMWTGQLNGGQLQTLPPEIHMQARRIRDLYLQIPSKEVWYYRAVDQQVEQLNALEADGHLPAHIIIKLKSTLLHRLEEHADWMERGEKSEGTYLKVSKAPYFTMGNGATLFTEERRFLWSAMWNAQSVSSNARRLTDRFMEQWEAHRKRAVSLTSGPPAVRKEWRTYLTNLFLPHTNQAAL